MSQMTGIERYKLVYYEAVVEKRWKVTKVTPVYGSGQNTLIEHKSS